MGAHARCQIANFIVALALPFRLFLFINVFLPGGALGMMLDKGIGASSITRVRKKGIALNKRDCAGQSL